MNLPTLLLLASSSLFLSHQESTSEARVQEPTSEATSEARVKLDGANNKALISTLQSLVGNDLEMLLEEGNVLVIRGEENLVGQAQKVLANMQRAKKGPDALLPIPKDGLTFRDGDTPITIMALLQQYVDRSRMFLVIAEDHRSRMQNTNLDASCPQALEGSAAVHYMESVLAMNNVYLGSTVSESQVFLHVLSTQGASTARRNTAPMFVSEEALAPFADHPALHITTLVYLPSTDVRSLSNTMRQMIRDPNFEQMLPMGSGNAFLLQGPGPWVYQMTQAMRLADTLQGEQMAQAIKARTPLQKVIRLEHAQAQSIADALQAILAPLQSEQVAGPVDANRRSTKAVEFRLHVDVPSNSVVLSCKPEMMEAALNLVAQLDIEAK